MTKQERQQPLRPTSQMAETENTVLTRPVAPTRGDTISEDQWDGLGYAIASQEILARDWLSPEDDIDWHEFFGLDTEETG